MKIFVAVVSLIFMTAVSSWAVSVGEKAPYFKVVSGDDKALTSDMTKGKLAVIFYETKHAKEKNRALKDELNAFYASKPAQVKDEVIRIAIIRCSRFFSDVWRRSLRENSIKEGIVIYGDWDGSMQADYGMIPEESNFLIIDKFGVIRYARSGVIPEKDFDLIKKLLDELR